MTAVPVTPERETPARAAALVDLGLRECSENGRSDLAERLSFTKRSLVDPAVYLVVVGDFKRGKSSLVNALVAERLCPVDDNLATAVPTYVRYGAQPLAQLILDPPR